MSIREKIFQANDSQEEKLYIPEWDVNVLVKTLSGKDRAWLLQHNMLPNGKPDLEKMLPALIISTVYDPDTNEKAFTPADRDAINEKNGSILDRIADVSMKVNKLRPQDQQDAIKN